MTLAEAFDDVATVLFAVVILPPLWLMCAVSRWWDRRVNGARW